MGKTRQLLQGTTACLSSPLSDMCSLLGPDTPAHSRMRRALKVCCSALTQPPWLRHSCTQPHAPSTQVRCRSALAPALGAHPAARRTAGAGTAGRCPPRRSAAAPARPAAPPCCAGPGPAPTPAAPAAPASAPAAAAAAPGPTHRDHAGLLGQSQTGCWVRVRRPSCS